MFSHQNVYLFFVIFIYCNILEQSDLLYMCVSMHLPTNYRLFSSLFRVAKCTCELCSDLVIPSTNIIYVLLFVNYYINIMLYSWWINLNWIELNRYAQGDHQNIYTSPSGLVVMRRFVSMVRVGCITTKYIDRLYVTIS